MKGAPRKRNVEDYDKRRDDDKPFMLFFTDEAVISDWIYNSKPSDNIRAMQNVTVINKPACSRLYHINVTSDWLT